MKKKNKYSKGEAVISRFLKKNNIKFEREKQFLNTKVNKQLPFDFHIPSHNLCIEYNGIQHYKLTKYSRTNLKRRQANDKLREDYCERTGISLLVIPYWEFENIEKILEYRLLYSEKLAV